MRLMVKNSNVKFMVKLKYKPFWWVPLLLPAMFLLYACSADHTSPLTDTSEDDDPPSEVTAVDVSLGGLTRAANMTLNSFGLSVLNVASGTYVVDKLQYGKTGSGFGPVSGSFRMITGQMKAIAVSPSMTILENVTLTNDDQSFDYEVPTTDQTMIKISGNMSFTRASAKNKLALNFVNAISQFTVKARNELKLEVGDKEYEVDLYVKGITLHNFASKGHFQYTADYNGTWTPIDGYWANYTQEFPSAVKLSTTSFINVVDSVFVLLPQSPEQNAWAPAGLVNPPAEDAISVANANHKAYIELRCAMTIQRDNQTVYVLGGPTTFRPVYFPYIKKYCPKAWNAVNRQGVYNLKIVKAEALDSNGSPIRPEELTDENGQFENAVFIEVAPTDDYNNDNVDDWPDADIIDVTI